METERIDKLNLKKQTFLSMFINLQAELCLIEKSSFRRNTDV